ncbi:MAG: exodeoxyribonuclease VII small subunit [Acidimicrobiia bacterium]
MTDAAPDPIGYTAAIEELDSILRQLEIEEVDVDVLGTRVRRAVELIAMCKQRISAAEIEVESIVAELDEEGRDASA